MIPVFIFSIFCQTATPNNTSDKVYCNCSASNNGCSGGYSSYYTNDYFSGAQKTCKTLLGSSWGLAPIGVEKDYGTTSSGNNLNAYCNKHKSTLGISDGYFWSSTPSSDLGNYAWLVNFATCNSHHWYRNAYHALCLYNP